MSYSYRNGSIVGEDTQREQGRSAQRNNIAAARAVAQTVRTTLGPKGMDKMLVDEAGSVIVTNDGVTILKEMQIAHPAAKMVVEVAKTQEDVVGDGTTSAVILAGELLSQAELLLDQGIHPTLITRGYRQAQLHAQNVLTDLARPVGADDKQLLLRLAQTAMTGKGAEGSRAHLSELVVEAARLVHAHTQHSGRIRDRVHLTRVTQAQNSFLVKGIVLEKERVHPQMPERIEQGALALLNVPLEIKGTDIDAKIQITDPSQISGFLEQEENHLRSLVDMIASSGARVVISQKGIDDVAQHFLAKKGILALRRVKKSTMERLARATGARIVTSLRDFSPQDLGSSSLVEERQVGDERLVFVEGCRYASDVTLVIDGSTSHIREELERAVSDALGDVSCALESGKIVGGAGSVEIALCRKLEEYAHTLAGREQLIVLSFARSVEAIARTLAENAGLDAIDTLASLRAAHVNGEIFSGIDVERGGVINAWERGIVEPLLVKTRALQSAREVAEMILRIDDVILMRSGENEKEKNELV